MKPAAYLDAAKAELNIESDYALGKAIGLSPKTMPAIRRGDRAMPLEAAYKLAITLKMDPAAVIADLEEQREKNESRRAFWRSFLSRAALIVAALGCTLGSMPSATYESATALFGGKSRRWKNA